MVSISDLCSSRDGSRATLPVGREQNLGCIEQGQGSGQCNAPCLPKLWAVLGWFRCSRFDVLYRVKAGSGRMDWIGMSAENHPIDEFAEPDIFTPISK